MYVANRSTVDGRRRQHTEYALRFMSQLIRLVNSLHSPEISFLLTRTLHRRQLSRTAKLRLVSGAAISSRAAGGHQIDPIKPTKMGADSTERLESSAILDPAHDFVAVDNPADEVFAPEESLVAENPGLGAVEGVESSEDSVEEEEEELSMVDDEEVGEVPQEEFLDSQERRILPEELSRNVLVLTCDSADGRPCDVYLVGTAHVSEESCRDVRGVMNFVKPEVVFLELCPSRLAVLTANDVKVPTMDEMIEMWKKKQNPFGILYSWFLAKVADKLDVKPGSEFRVGFEEAREWGSKIILGDRPVDVTLRRTWRKMPFLHKIKLIFSLFLQAWFLPSSEDLNKMLNDLNDNDMLTMVVQEMSKQFPTLMETLVDERDQYMSSTLLRVASYHHSVVAVVGKGHLQGIHKYWLQPVEIDKLMEIPSTASSSAKIVKSLGVAAVGVAIVTGIYLAARKR